MAMYAETFVRGPREGVGERYAREARETVRGVVYDSLPAKKAEARFRAAQRGPEEQAQHRLELAWRLAEGVDAHVEANALFYEDWQEVLAAQEAPETLTREEVAALRESFTDEAALTQGEQRAKAHYDQMLLLGKEWSLPVSDYIAIHRTDAAMLVNDLIVRQVERELDAPRRKRVLQQLDQGLVQLIDAVPKEDWGKKMELQEMYLFRRLIHDADAGHLVTVEHSLPHEDLRAEHAMDLRIAVAGEVANVQVKTFKSDVDIEKRVRHAELEQQAAQRLQHTNVRLVRLEMAEVTRAYDNAVRQASTGERMTLTNTYEALRPLMDVFSPRGRQRLLHVLGITEEQLAAEQEAFEEREVAMRAHQADYFLMKERHAQEMQEEAARVAAEREAQEAAQREEEYAKEALRERIRQADIDAGTEKIRARAAVSSRRQQTSLKRFQEGLEEAEARRAEEARLAAEEAAKEAKREEMRKKREAKEALGWPPKTLLEVVKPPLLQSLGLLEEGWQKNPAALLAAKKQFLALYAQPKKGQSPTEKDAPNALFKKTFPTAASLESTDQRAA